MNFVVFDFCETLVNFQTADAFVDYIIEQKKHNRLAFLNFIGRVFYRLRIIALANKLIPGLNLSKRLKLYQLKGLLQSDLDAYAISFYHQRIKGNLIDNVYKKLQAHQKNGDFICISSGGYLPYIKIFAQENNISLVFATQIEVKKGIVTGHFMGKDCLDIQKTFLLKEYYTAKEVNFDRTIAYSDSPTDLPLLKWAKQAYVVSSKKPQAWAANHGFKEIIW